MKNTRGAAGGGTIRQRSNGMWEARYTVGRDPGTGKQVQRSVYGHTQQEVRRKLAEATRSIDSGLYLEPERMTVGQWLDVWEKEYCGGVKERTRQLYARVIAFRINTGLGAVPLQKLSAVQVQRFYNDLSRSGLAPKSVRNIHGILHKALAQAVTLGYIARNPSEGCELPRCPKKEISPFEASEIPAFLDAIKGDPFERLFLVALFTGMREGEALGLPWDSVDFDAGTISVTQQEALFKKPEGGYERRITEPKNGRARLFAAAPSVLDILRRQRIEQNRLKLAAGKLWHENGLVFTAEDGSMLARNTVYEHFRRAAAAAGKPEARFHDLRHTFALASLESGVNVKTVQEALGHATAAFTLDVYGHVSGKMQKDGAEKIENFIQNMTVK